MKSSTLIMLFWVVSIFKGQAQRLERQILSKEELREGVIFKYVYSGKSSYGVIVLTLFKSGKYSYTMETFGKSSYSEGKWSIKEKKYILNSSLKWDNLPVRLTYLKDVVDYNGNFPFNIVENIKGESFTDAFVYINNDTVQCLPLTETCLSTYKRIDSIKVVLENNMSSKWIKVEDKPYKKLQIILQLDIPLANYQVFMNKTYKIDKTSILSID